MAYDPNRPTTYGSNERDIDRAAAQPYEADDTARDKAQQTASDDKAKAQELAGDAQANSSDTSATYSGSSSSRYNPSSSAAPDNPSSSSSSQGGKQVSSSPTQSFGAMSDMPNADYDNIGQMNRVGMPPPNNPSDTSYYEEATPGTSSDRPEPPAATPSAMDEQAKNETRKYTQ